MFPQKELEDNKIFEETLTSFIHEYKEFCKKYIKPESLAIYKYQDMPKLYDEAREKWRNDSTRFVHQQTSVDVYKELQEIFPTLNIKNMG